MVEAVSNGLGGGVSQNINIFQEFKEISKKLEEITHQNQPINNDREEKQEFTHNSLSLDDEQKEALSKNIERAKQILEESINDKVDKAQRRLVGKGVRGVEAELIGSDNVLMLIGKDDRDHVVFMSGNFRNALKGDKVKEAMSEFLGRRLDVVV